MPSEAKELLYNWRKVGSRKSNFFQVYLLQERFFFRTSYKTFHQLDNPLSLQRFSGYVLERSATPPQNLCEAFSDLVFLPQVFALTFIFLAFHTTPSVRTATCTK